MNTTDEVAVVNGRERVELHLSWEVGPLYGKHRQFVLLKSTLFLIITYKNSELLCNMKIYQQQY